MQSIQQIANQNEAAKVVFSALGERQRFRRQTDLRRLMNNIMSGGQRLVEDDFMDVFKSLERAGVGSIIHRRGNHPPRFKWYYNLKDVAKAANQGSTLKSLKPFSEASTEPKKGKGRGRPKGSKNKIMSKADILNEINKLMKKLL